MAGSVKSSKKYKESKEKMICVFSTKGQPSIFWLIHLSSFQREITKECVCVCVCVYKTFLLKLHHLFNLNLVL